MSEMLASVSSERSNLLDSLFTDYEGPVFGIRMWDGWSWVSRRDGKPRCTVVIQSADALEALVARPSEITLGEAFLAGEIDVEGDIFAVFAMTQHVLASQKGRRQRVRETAMRLLAGMGQWCKKGRRHSIARDRAAIAHHYDQPVDFYRPWLGESLAYSCAYFRSAGDDLGAAQANKLDLICRKLRLERDDRFLDIGCGWGSLPLHAAAHYGAYAKGITISREQAAVASDRIAEAHLTQSCDVELLDYREAPKRFGVFDKIASVGMFEHVGLKNLPRYFRTAYEMLRPGGAFLNHGIARADETADGGRRLMSHGIDWLRKVPVLRDLHGASFIDQYVFPDGELVTIADAVHAAEEAGFEVRDVENLREHYELTLRAWVEGLRKNAEALRKQVAERTYRTWLLYMAGCAAAFHRGDIAVYQMLLSKPKRGESRMPLTREDWYAPHGRDYFAGAA